MDETKAFEERLNLIRMQARKLRKKYASLYALDEKTFLTIVRLALKDRQKRCRGL